MNIEELREYCLSKQGVTEEFPFNEDTLVFKVMGKMFALTGMNDPDHTVNLKCDPHFAIELREQYPDDVMPGYHMNKKHWNTVTYSGRLDDDYVKGLVDHSYKLVVDSLPKKLKSELSS